MERKKEIFENLFCFRNMTTRKRASAVDHKNKENLNVICRIMRSSRGVKLEGKNTFQGIELCNWLIRAHYATDVDSAISLSNQLMMSTNTFEPVDKSTSSLRYDDSLYVFFNEDVDEKLSPSSPPREKKSDRREKEPQAKQPGRFDRILSKLEVISPERRDVGAVFIAISYACGYFDLGFAAAILIYAGWCFFVSVHNRISDAHQRKRVIENALDGDDESELALIRLSPPWFRCADIERARWFNLLLKQLWQNGLSRSVDETVSELLDWKLEELRPSFIRSFKVKHCDFTTLRPHVMGVKTYRHSETEDEKSCMIDLDVEILSEDPQALVVSARLLTGPVHVAAGNITLKGKLRLHFCDPFDYFMPFRLLNISFVTMPEVDFSLCALTKGFDFNKIGGVRTKISSLVNESLTDLMVWYVFRSLHLFKIEKEILKLFLNMTAGPMCIHTKCSTHCSKPRFKLQF